MNKETSKYVAPVPVLAKDIVIAVSDRKEIYREILIDFDKSSFAEDWQRNSSWQISFDVTGTDRNSFAFDLIKDESIIYYKSERYIVTQLDEQATGRQLTKSVLATHEFYQLQHDRQENTISGRKSINECIEHLLKGSKRGYTFEIIGTFDKVDQENFGNINIVEGLNEVLADYGAILDFNGKHLIFYEPKLFGEKIQETIRYKHNTDEIQFQSDTTALKTQIVGYGKQKDEEQGGGYYFDPIIYTSPIAEDWGVRVADPVSDDRFTDATAMLRKLKETLQDYPTITGSVKLKKLMDINKGDWIKVLYEPLNNMELDVQVVGYKKYPFLNKPPEITLSNSKSDILSIQIQLAKQIRKLQRG
ncbi:phage tail protein [Terribacillus sp. 7520-G]|uniref:phage tail protein n=1 Tax=Terribacillus sp. 7520-G TaxID=2025389 RepID=UPI000BA5A00C|nr:phage tail protein [Terribacillus sp. 7520-G]PAD39822.1 hypothetical protein CHH53_04060 [Terribacillus sp. 7520-G]